MARGYNRLPLAAALLATATSASAAGGIVAGDWTLDIGGIVNAYYTSTHHTGASHGLIGGANTTGTATSSNITTGLLPNYLTVSGKTRQNDLDVGFTISIQPGTSNTHALDYAQSATHAPQENRQAFLTFGDASWGSFKLGKDLGIYASDAILNDMTLLGVGSAAGSLTGNTTTLGGIGAGYIYADWKPQIAYTTPNFNGFSATGGLTQSWGDAARGGSQPAFEGKASYDFTADAVTGKVWVSGITQKLQTANERAEAWDIGANVNVAGFGVTAYYGQGSGIGSLAQMSDSTGKLDSQDWYVQATYVLPTKTKIGARYGESEIDVAGGNNTTTNDMWVVGAYHPLTKHLNLVAEYSDATASGTAAGYVDGKNKTVSLGAILFF